MGQQQLILLVLATVIVGLAIVVGIQAFTENSDRANADALMHDAVRVANDAQALVKKPAAFGGVNALTEATFATLGYPANGDYYMNLNGAFEIATSGSGVVITGYGGDGVVTESETTAGEYVFNEGAVQQEVSVAVCGPGEEHITSSVIKIGGQGTGAAAESC